MTSTRLNMEIRHSIRRELLQGARKDKEIEAAQEAKLQYADMIYTKVFTPHVVQRMYQLPEGWLPTSDRFRILYGTGYKTIELRQPKRMPNNLARSFNPVNTTPFERDDALICSWEKQDHVIQELRNEYRRLERDVITVLDGCRTTKQLIEVWPEIEHVVRKYEQPKQRVQLPAKPLPALTHELGLKQISGPTIDATALPAQPQQSITHQPQDD